MTARGNRDKVIIATKVGGPTGVHETDSSRRHILEGVEKSLERLQTNYIDLYYLHYDDEKTPIEETLRTFHELVKAGKVNTLRFQIFLRSDFVNHWNFQRKTTFLNIRHCSLCTI